MSNLTIVIPNYNGSRLLRRNLPSVLAAAKTHDAGTKVIVVDDGSVDDSVRVLCDEFPEVKLVRHEVNRGFSEAVLSGVKAAESELVFLLNSDVEMHLDSLPLLATYFADPHTFSVNPLMLNDDGSVNRHSWNLRSFQRGYLKLDEWELPQALELRDQASLPSLYACGGCMMTRKAMFLELGGFHPIYKPFYGEDYDLGIRAWYRGWSTYFEPRVSVIHQSQGSIKDNVKRAYVKRIRRRNRYFLEWMHMSKVQLLFSTLPWSVFQLLGELLILDRTNLKGFFDAVVALPDVLKARREVMNSRHVSLEKIVEAIHGFK